MEMSRDDVQGDGEWDLKKAVHELSRAAYDLAKDAARNQGEQAKLETRAREMDSFLDELVPHIQAAPPDDQPELQAEWTDARQDITYVLSGGTLPTSIRMHHYLQSQE
jgi:hypothetical protein